MAPVLSTDLIKTHFLPVMQSLSHDPVANVRMNVCKTVTGIAAKVKGTGDLETKVKVILKELSNDADFDVKFYAQRAVEALK